jgi:hypothetical protein
MKLFKCPDPNAIQTMSRHPIMSVNEELFGLLSPNSFGNLPVNTNSLIRYFLRLDISYIYMDDMSTFCYFFYYLVSLTNDSYITSLLLPATEPTVTGVNFEVILGPAYKVISLASVVCAALYSEQ